MPPKTPYPKTAWPVGAMYSDESDSGETSDDSSSSDSYEPPSPSHFPTESESSEGPDLAGASGDGREAVRAAERVASDVNARNDAIGRRYTRCIVCWDRAPIYAPRCGHVCLCGTCANEMIRIRGTCPVCRGPVNSDDLRRTFAFGPTVRKRRQG